MNRKTIGLVAGLLAASWTVARAAGDPKVASDARLEASAKSVARMKASMAQVVAKVEEARAERDVVKLNCVDEKLAQIGALLKVAERADVALREAVSSRDPAADTELAKIAIARTKVDALRADSERCIGKLAWAVEEKTTVDVKKR